MMTKLLKAFGLLAITAAVASLAPAQAQTTVRYLHTDALGTVVAKTDANGNVVERTMFEPYGAVVGGAVADGPGYTGHVSDAATGLSYMQQRYYDPEVGLFLSVDPVTAYGSGEWRQLNRYTYGFNNPYRFNDPDGRNPAGGAAIGCAISGPACPAGAAVGAVIGTAVIVVAAIIAYNESSDSSPTDGGAEPGTAESDEGCIYCVPGSGTSSGDEYVGSADDLGRRARDKSDGRDRTQAVKVDAYKKGDRTDRQEKEQKAINDRGGRDSLDNKRNEIAESKWPDRGIEPPAQK